ncbi:MAG: hypothetical protein KA250_03365 [Verrucomicrobiales bacterium]|jgi:hypothetical protein|nr:hypothetical protein [Verrucomicrobiales bacterium]MBP9224096.1 hypothetical protein [Verrucomicrobiales bacterium]HQZ29146.1 Ig-like domain-containing protein [Verrucomicrobiales bacterium]
MGTTAPPCFLAVYLLAISSVGARDIPVPAPPEKGLKKRVIEIWPEESLVPANHLKFYLRFPQPMERNEVFRHLRLVEVDEKGSEVAEVPEPFREVELWDETFTRMTLWFHPGRQKPGVNLNVEIGPILEEGKRYRLEISSAWKSETGETLFPNGHHHPFSAGPADNDSPNPAQWKIESAPTGERIPIKPGETLDVFSFQKRVTLVKRSDPQTALPCRIEFRPESFLLTPKERLAPGDYTLVIDPRLEDLAGNSIARPFNLDLEKQPDFKERTEPVILPFSVP